METRGAIRRASGASEASGIRNMAFVLHQNIGTSKGKDKGKGQGIIISA